MLAGGALTCYGSKEEVGRGGEARDQLLLTQHTQVVEMKAKGACSVIARRGRVGG